ncbi:hypothetical protein PMAC_003320 [Pneumocystis sp. 'macacae']|nr:hypothetical protein PMAC_003320 [Pneumocystis sp. 'macacae']
MLKRWLCKFGDNCRNKHVEVEKSAFFGLDRSFQKHFNSNIINHTINESLIEDDLGKDHPQWPFTCYGTGKGHPNLISGKDISPEELRTIAYKYIENMDFYGYQNIVKKLSEEIQGLKNNIIRNSKKACRIAINLLNGKFSGNIDAIFSNIFPSNPSAFSTFSTQINLTKTHSSFGSSMPMPIHSSNAFGKIEPYTSSLFKKEDQFFSSFYPNSSNTLPFGTHSSLLSTTSSSEPIFSNTLSIQVPTRIESNSVSKINHQPSYLISNTHNSVFNQYNVFNPTQAQSALNYKSAFNQHLSVFSTSDIPQINQEKIETSQFASNMTSISTFAFNSTPTSAFTFQPTLQESFKSAFLTPIQQTNNSEIILPNHDISNSLSESDLPASALEAFKAKTFTLGGIPEIEPPFSLRS